MGEPREPIKLDKKGKPIKPEVKPVSHMLEKNKKIVQHKEALIKQRELL